MIVNNCKSTGKPKIVFNGIAAKKTYLKILMHRENHIVY